MTVDGESSISKSTQGDQIGTNYFAMFCLVRVRIVIEACPVPDDDILPHDIFTGEEDIVLDGSRGSGAINTTHPVMEFVIVVPDYPDVAFRPRVPIAIAVVTLRNDLVAFVLTIFHDPFFVPVSKAFGFPLEVVVLPPQRPGAFSHPVIGSTVDVKIQAPVNMVEVQPAGAVVLRSSEFKSRLNGSVGMESPFAGIAVPACGEFADEDDFLSPYKNTDTSEIAGVILVVGERLWLCAADTESCSADVCSCRAVKTGFLILPVAIGSTGVFVIVNIQYRNVCAVEHFLPAEVDIAQLHTGAFVRMS